MIFITVSAMFPTFIYAATQRQALNWIYARHGESVDYDGLYGAQCVDLIKAYYAYLNAGDIFGNGKDYKSNQLPDGWTRAKFTDISASLQPGDILVDTDATANGHVAIFIKWDAANNAIIRAEQKRIKAACYQCGAYNDPSHVHIYSDSYCWDYVIRPKFEKAPPPIAFITVSYKAIGSLAANADWNSILTLACSFNNLLYLRCQ
jgi:hypothetical protein